MNLSSTLVETVSIDYEDFNESFLTCSTCLCKFIDIFDLPLINNSLITQVTTMLQNIIPNYCHVPTLSA